MLFKLAFRNVRRQIGNYLIYFVTVSLTVALMFAVNNFIFCDLMEMVQEDLADFIHELLVGISWGIGIVAAFVLGYVTSYLLRRRKKEFGLYLTLGMSRANILTIFAGETAVNFLLSLATGVGMGMGLFPLLVYVAFRFLGLDYIPTNYSLEGSLLTVAIIAVVFLLSSAVSLFYLGYAKISSLLNGERKVERAGKYPILWFSLVLVSIFGMWYSGLDIYEIMVVLKDTYWHLSEMLTAILIMTASIMVFLFGLAKGVVPTLLKWKWFASRGVNTFTLRQLSGRLNANAMMLSILSVLLSVAVVATNFMVNMRSGREMEVLADYPYDIFGSVDLRWVDYNDVYSDISIEDGVAMTERYAEIEKKVEYFIYAPSMDREQFDVCYLRESDYRAICEVLGRTPMERGDGFLFLYRDEPDWYNPINTSIPVTLNGVTYSYYDKEQFLLIPGGGILAPYTYVVADEAVVGLEKVFHNVAIELKSNDFDAYGLGKAFRREDGMGNRNFNCQEFERRRVLEEALIYLLITIFISIVFVMLSMAVIGLKVLTMISEDKERYRAIWRVGADKRNLRGSLFAQIFFFFFLPFGMPLCLSVPIGMMLMEGTQLSYVVLPMEVIVGQVAAIAGVLLALYSVYFVITYFVSWIETKRNLRNS